MRTWHFPPTGFGRSISLGVSVRVGVLLFLAAGVVLLAELPPFIEFGVAVMAAVCWTVFLDRYWTGARPEPTPEGGRRMRMPTRASVPLIAIHRPPAPSHEDTKAA